MKLFVASLAFVAVAAAMPSPDQPPRQERDAPRSTSNVYYKPAPSTSTTSYAPAPPKRQTYGSAPTRHQPRQSYGDIQTELLALKEQQKYLDEQKLKLQERALAQLEAATEALKLAEHKEEDEEDEEEEETVQQEQQFVTVQVVPQQQQQQFVTVPLSSLNQQTTQQNNQQQFVLRTATAGAATQQANQQLGQQLVLTTAGGAATQQTVGNLGAVGTAVGGQQQITLQLNDGRTITVPAALLNQQN